MSKGIRIFITGDLFPADSEQNIGKGIASYFQKDNGSNWTSKFEGYLQQSDIAFVNLESPLCYNNLHNVDYCGNIQFAMYMKSIGITGVSIANNHILEHGMAGFNDTIKSLQNSGLLVAGQSSFDGRSKIIRHHLKGKNIAIAAFNAIHDIENPGCYAEYSKENVLYSINEMIMMKDDLKIVYLHWGNEYIHLPAVWQIADARAFIDAGADLVIGSHPHVIQPVESYKHGVIYYSLGNFVFDMFDSEHVRVGMVVRIILNEDGTFKSDHDLLYIGRDFMPVPLKGKKLIKYESLLDMNGRYITDLYERFPNKYEAYYLRELKRRHTIQRIKMKYELIKQWPYMTREARSRLLGLWKKKLLKK
jgi:poly-gamma-glutamate synthesis protein (capsule biosynthesis protein)